jgi:phosphoglycolate phosphatase-like HAD superfamily hydrolase
VESLRTGQADPEQYLVPGSRQLLESLRERGLTLYLASGTDQEYMQAEAELLGITRYFDGGVFGALDDLSKFSKKILVNRILAQSAFSGKQILGFGDGYVEIEEVKLVGGVAVGVATTEPECQVIDDWKRTRLIGVGADYIVPNYLCHDQLMQALFAANGHG